MEQDREQAKQVLHQLMELGEAMLVNGAEVNRVEDTLVRLGAAYGASQMHVFVITSSMIITMVLPDGDEITQTRRILGAGGTDFKKVEALNALSRRCCSQPFPIAELASEIGRLKRAAPDPKYLCVGSALAAGSFAVFYGGSLMDGILAALFGLLIYAMQDSIAPFCMNKVIFNLLAAFFVRYRHLSVRTDCTRTAGGQDHDRRYHAAHPGHRDDQCDPRYSDRRHDCGTHAAD